MTAGQETTEPGDYSRVGKGRISARPVPLGADGKPMSVWQIWLRRLCLVMIGWAALELILGAVLWAFGLTMGSIHVIGVELYDLAAFVGTTALVNAVLSLIIGLLGVRGAKNPYKITLFFWIMLSDAVVTAWAMASSLSSGIFDATGVVNGLFIIALALCAWQVRGQTGYFDERP